MQAHFLLYSSKVSLYAAWKQTSRSCCAALGLLRSEILSGMCAKLRTVAASNNRDHARNLSLRMLVAAFYRSHVNIGRATTSQSLLLFLLALHIWWCCSSRTSRSWWITQSTQHHWRGCNRVIKTSLHQDGFINVQRFWLNLHLFHTVWSNEHFANNGTSFRNHDMLLVISASSVKANTFWRRASSRLHFCSNEDTLLLTWLQWVRCKQVLEAAKRLFLSVSRHVVKTTFKTVRLSAITKQ